jgi:RNA polymerase sigma factor (TIGR02999 family)
MAKNGGPGSAAAVTQLLQEWSAGDPDALNRLAPLVEPELKRIARRYLFRERPGHTLQPTALVNEAYLRLIGQGAMSWKNRLHFYAVAAQTMRRVLVDYARECRAQKRGGGREAIPFDDTIVCGSRQSLDIVALHEALVSLAALDARQSHVVELLYFGGLTIAEVAEFLEVSTTTVDRDLRTARMWLRRELARR